MGDVVRVCVCVCVQYLAECNRCRNSVEVGQKRD